MSMRFPRIEGIAMTYLDSAKFCQGTNRWAPGLKPHVEQGILPQSSCKSKNSFQNAVTEDGFIEEQFGVGRCRHYLHSELVLVIF